MSRPIDDNWHYIDGKTVYIIPMKVYKNFDDTDENCEYEETHLTLCEDCFDALLKLIKYEAE